jgi:hypothetical protein
MCPKVLSDFKQIRDILTDFHKSLQNQVSGKFVHWEPSTYRRKGGQSDRQEANGSYFPAVVKAPSYLAATISRSTEYCVVEKKSLRATDADSY